MFKEQAYLLLKTGRRDQAIELLANHSGSNLVDVLKIASEFDVQSDDLWGEVLRNADGDTEKVKELLKYSDFYEKPDKFVDVMDEELCLEDIQGDLMGALQQIKAQENVLKCALYSC